MFPREYEVDISSDFKIIPLYSDELADKGIVWISYHNSVAKAVYTGVKISKEEYMTIKKYKSLMNELNNRLQESLELEEVFRPNIPPDTRFSQEDSSFFFEFTLGSVKIEVAFDKETNTHYEVSFTSVSDSGYNSGRRQFHNINPIKLFQNIVGIVVKFMKEKPSVKSLGIRPPDFQPERINLYLEILNRREIIQYSKLNGVEFSLRKSDGGILVERK